MNTFWRNITVTIAAVLFICCGLYAAEPAQPLLLVLDKPGGQMLLVDPAAKKVVGQVPTGVGPHEVTVSVDGKLAFVANYGDQTPGSSLSVIDLAMRKELRRVDLGPLRRPHGIVESKGKIYFTAEVNKVVARYDPVADRIDWLMGTGEDVSHMLVINRDENRIATSNIGSDSVAILKPAAPGGNNWRVTVVPVGKRPEAIDLSPDGREVWTSHSADGGVSVIDLETEKVVATIPSLTKHSNRLKFTPDGKLALISDAEGNEIVVLDARTRKLVKKIPVGEQPLGIQMAPGGRHAYVACAKTGKVAIIDLKELAMAGTIDVAQGIDGMAWVENPATVQH